MKKLSFVIFLSVLTVFAQAQTLRVHLKNGTSVYYSSEQVDYVDFVEETAEPNPGTDADPENTRHIKEPYFSETVELMGLLWRLAGSSEYCQCEVATVAESADSYFAPMKNHQAVTLAKRYSQQNIVYDAVTAYANQLIFDQSGELIFDPNYQEGSNNGLDRWSNTQKTEMLAAINDFYKASNFHDWFASTAKEQQEAIASFKSICSVDYEWFDKYYGKNDKVASRIILSFMAGRNNYGISLTRKDGTFQLSPIYGCLSQVRGEVWFGANMDLIIHEFSHPYCNPLIFANWTTISEKSEEIFKTVSTLLSSQAYTEAQTMICETLVRASSTIYMKTHNQGNKVESELIRQENTGFPLVRPIYNMIVERGAGENVILADLMPEIIKIINEFDYEKEEPTPETEKDNTATEFPTNHDYVDLDIKFSDGRKLYFATTNVGETTIGGTGSYSYCWGATEPFRPAWVNNEGIEVWPKGHTLDSDHDLCTVMWGGDWKTPTEEHWQALIDQCDYEYVDASATSYGIAGCFIYNKTDHSKQIFLPSLSFDDTQVWYWSSEICGTQDDLSNCATAFLGSFDGNSFTMGFYAVGLGSDAFLYRPVIEASGSFNSNDHDYVDLGITINGKKLYFSTMDLGASEVGQSGIPSRWGATDYYGEEWVAPGFHKPDWNPGKRLDAEHDIATIEWGTAWHMPSPEEWDMLVEQCDYERKEASDCIYGVNGYFFYKRSDHSTFIFLPVANWCDELQYWTSEIGMPYAGETTAIVFGSNENSIGCISTGGLSSGGISVRPVFVK